MDKRNDGRRPDSSAFHRLREVRRQQGVSLRTMARRMGTDIESVRQQENSLRDLSLSDLMKWRDALEVPICDLLVEPSMCLSPGIQQRARLVRLMKTAAAISENAKSPDVARMAGNLVDELIGIMPELKEVSSWHTVGRRRTLSEVGRVLEQIVREDVFWQVSDSD